MQTEPQTTFNTADEVMSYADNGYGNTTSRLDTLFPNLIASTNSVTAAFFKRREIPFLRHMTGWGGTKRYPRPILGRYLYPKEYESLLNAYLNKNIKPEVDPETVAKRKARAEKANATKLSNRRTRFMAIARQQFPNMPDDDLEELTTHTTEFKTGRVGTIKDTAASVRPAVVAFIRHHYTNYDQLMETYCDAYCTARRFGLDYQVELPNGESLDTEERLNEGRPSPREAIRVACREAVREVIDEKLAEWSQS
jgi:hypothetical protein